MRKKLVSHINTILGLNGIEQDLILKPLSFNISEVEERKVEVNPDIKEISNDENEDTSILN